MAVRRPALEVARERAELARLRLETDVLRARRAQIRAYEAADTKPYRKVRGDSRSGNAAIGPAGTKLRQWARYLDENHDLAIGVLDDLVKKIVGCGIQTMPAVQTVAGDLAERTNDALAALWADWRDATPETTRSLCWPQIEAMACRTWLRDGEFLAQHVAGTGRGLTHRSRVPYSLELLEPDYLPFALVQESTATQNRIVHGVELSDWREPIAYHLYLEHPGELLTMSGLSPETIYARTKRMPAELIAHVRLVRRLGQVRGVTIFRGVLTRLDDLRDYEESERVAARVAAAFTAVITKSTDYAGAANLSTATGNRQMEMNPGMIFDDLLPGESVATIGTNRPSEQLGPFRESQLRAVASGTGSSYSGASRNYNGTYSAQRQELVESWIGYEMAREDLISQFHRPVWRRFVDTAIAAGLVPLAGVDPMTMYRADFVGPAMPWIDPVKEVDAKVRAIGARLISRHMVIRESQYDPELIDEQIAADPYAPASGAGEAGEARDADEEIAA